MDLEELNFEEQFQLVAEFFLRCKKAGKDVAKYEKAMTDLYLYANNQRLQRKLYRDKFYQIQDINNDNVKRLKIYDEKFGS